MSESENTVAEWPQAPTAEKAVLSMMMNELKFHPRGNAEGIDADCFHAPGRRELWLAIGRYRESHPEHTEVDPGLIVQTLSLESRLEGMGGASAIADILTHAPGARASFSSFCEILREMKARRLAKNASATIRECGDSQEAVDTAKKLLADLTNAICGKQRSVSVKEATAAFVQQFHDDFSAGDIPGLSTGLLEIDQLSGGMRPGEFWVICGKPSRGKSALMFQIVTEAVLSQAPSVVFSLEMMQSQVIGRMVTFESRINYSSITQPRLAKKKDIDGLKAAIEKLSTAPLWIDASAGQSIDSITAETERICDQQGTLKLIVVDYLQLVRGNRARGESREEEVARVSAGLKQLAKKFNCTVLSASQLNDQGQTRESRAIEQDADALLFIVEDGIKIGKLRNGERDNVIPLFLDGSIQRFTCNRRDYP